MFQPSSIKITSQLQTFYQIRIYFAVKYYSDWLVAFWTYAVVKRLWYSHHFDLSQPFKMFQSSSGIKITSQLQTFNRIRIDKCFQNKSSNCKFWNLSLLTGLPLRNTFARATEIWKWSLLLIVLSLALWNPNYFELVTSCAMSKVEVFNVTKY
jgi:hypothetical protein